MDGRVTRNGMRILRGVESVGLVVIAAATGS